MDGSLPIITGALPAGVVALYGDANTVTTELADKISEFLEEPENFNAYNEALSNYSGDLSELALREKKLHDEQKKVARDQIMESMLFEVRVKPRCKQGEGAYAVSNGLSGDGFERIGVGVQDAYCEFRTLGVPQQRYGIAMVDSSACENDGQCRISYRVYCNGLSGIGSQQCSQLDLDTEFALFEVDGDRIKFLGYD